MVEENEGEGEDEINDQEVKTDRTSLSCTCSSPRESLPDTNMRQVICMLKTERFTFTIML